MPSAGTHPAPSEPAPSPLLPSHSVRGHDPADEPLARATLRGEPAQRLSPVGRGAPSWSVEPLQGWHLPLLDDPAFVPLHPLLQRALLMAVPERLANLVVRRQALAPMVLLALGRDRLGRQRPLALLVARRLNRSGSCWEVEHLRLALTTAEEPGTPGRQELSAGLLREAIERARGAASWIASASSLDTPRLACLREQGFQPLRTARLWRWQPGPQAASTAAGDLQFRPLNRRTAPLLWHLEQAACPALLRQLLDRRIEDLLDHSGGRGWLLVDPARNEAVAGVRWLADHPSGGQQVEFSVHPGWSQLLGSATEALLSRMVATDRGSEALWLASDCEDTDQLAWLTQLGAECHGEEVLMARSVWRRREDHPARSAARRLEAVLEQLQPRRRPLPTPVGPR